MPEHTSVPVWVWAVFAAFVVAMLVLDLLVLHRRAHEVALREAAIWTAVWLAIGLGFGGLLWLWQGGGAAETYLAGYLIEKSLSLDNIFVFTVIFAAFAIPPRYQHRVLMLGIVGALVMRAGFIVAGIRLLDAFHPVIYVFGAVLLVAAVQMLRPEAAPRPQRNLALRALRRVLPSTERLHGQRFLVRDGTRLLATPLLLALIVIETTDVIFAVDSIPAVLAVTTDPFVVYTSNVFALLGMRALYFLLAGATARFRYLRPGLAVILTAVAVKLLLADVYTAPAWASPVFITAVLAVVAVASIRHARRQRTSQHAQRQYPADQPASPPDVGGKPAPARMRLAARCAARQPAQTSGRRRPRSGTSGPVARAHARTSATGGPDSCGARSRSVAAAAPGGAVMRPDRGPGPRRARRRAGRSAAAAGRATANPGPGCDQQLHRFSLPPAMRSGALLTAGPWPCASRCPCR